MFMKTKVVVRNVGEDEKPLRGRSRDPLDHSNNDGRASSESAEGMPLVMETTT